MPGLLERLCLDAVIAQPAREVFGEAVEGDDASGAAPRTQATRVCAP